MKRILIALSTLTLLSCGGDVGLFDPTSLVQVTKKGCRTNSGGGTGIIINITSEVTPDGRVRCLIETVIPTASK